MSRTSRWISGLPLCALSVLLLWAPATAEAQQERTLELDVGEQTTISAVGVQRYSEGAPRVVEVRVTEREFIVVALRPGQTSLLLIYSSGRQVRYNIQVRDPNAVTTTPGSVTPRETIRLDLYFVELTETYSHQIGIGFPGTLAAPVAALEFDVVSAAFSTATLSLVNQVLPRIDLAQSQGWARLRRQAMLVTANGTPASLNSGGEVNIVVSGALAAELRQITFGSQLEMTPRFDSSTGRVEIQISANLSQLTPPNSAGGPPGRSVTELQSVANLDVGQAMMLSGVVSRSEQEAQGGLPGLSQIPILGVLFGTNQRLGEATQNVLFIVPTIVQSVERQQRNYIEEAFETFSRFSGFIHEVEMFETTPPGYGQPGGIGQVAPRRSDADGESD